MGLGRALLCVLLPPLAVVDAGRGTLLAVSSSTPDGRARGGIGAPVVHGRGKAR